MKAGVLRILGLILWLASVNTARAQVVFDAMPTVKVESSGDTTARFVLNRLERIEYSLTIMKRDGAYFWSTRENKELVHRVSGAFHYFIAIDGAGYIKILDTHFWPRSMRDPGPRYRYLEQLSSGLATITYWGTSDTVGDIDR